jgi:cobalt-zinc-cadmium efflux system outer membrane protein
MNCLACIAQAAGPLRLEEAIARALSANPALAAQSAQMRAVEARAGREALAPPLVLTTQVENALGTGAVAGLKGAEATVQVARDIELGGKRAARQALGRTSIARQRHEGVATELAIRALTTERFIELAVDQRRFMEAREQVVRSVDLVTEVARWVEAGRNSDADLNAAKIAVAEAELALEHALHERDAARVALAATWGAQQADFDEVTLDLDAMPGVPEFEELAARLDATPAFRAAAIEAEAAAARRRVAIANSKPDLTVGVGVRRLEALNEQALVMSMSLPLGSRRRAAPAITETEAQQAAGQAGTEAARIEARQALYAMYQEMIHARNEVEVVRDRLLPPAEEIEAFTRRGFEAGRFTFLALAQSQNAVFEFRQRMTEALARYHLRRAEILKLTAASGESLP